MPLRLAALFAGAAAAAGIGGGVALHELRGTGGSEAPSAFHGQASWPAGKRPAPQFSLRDQRGSRLSLASLRGRPVLLTFLDSRCHAQCPVEGRDLALVLQRLRPAGRPTLVVLSVDPEGDTPASIRHAMAKWRLAGPWPWYWLNGTPRQLASAWRAYGITVVPKAGDIVHSLALYLIDRRGFERTGYLFPFLPGFVQGDLRTLAADRAAASA